MRPFYCSACNERLMEIDHETLVTKRRRRACKTRSIVWVGRPATVRIATGPIPDLTGIDWVAADRADDLIKRGVMVRPVENAQPPDSLHRVALLLKCECGQVSNIYPPGVRARIDAIEAKLPPGGTITAAWKRSGRRIDLMELEVDPDWCERRAALRARWTEDLDDDQRARAVLDLAGVSVYDLDTIAEIIQSVVDVRLP